MIIEEADLRNKCCFTVDRPGFRLRVDCIRFAVLCEVKASITRPYICHVVIYILLTLIPTESHPNLRNDL
jgi:hypothetical protein